MYFAKLMFKIYQTFLRGIQLSISATFLMLFGIFLSNHRDPKWIVILNTNIFGLIFYIYLTTFDHAMVICM